MVSGYNRRGIKSADIDITNERIGRQKGRLGNLQGTVDNMVATNAMTVGAALPAGIAAVQSNPRQSSFIVKQRTKRKGAIVTMAFYIDKNTTKIRCRIIAFKDNQASSDTNVIQQARAAIIDYSWDDITDDERTAGYVTREFVHALEFETVYGVVRTIAVNDADGVYREVKFPDESSKPLKTLPFPIVNVYGADRMDVGLDACFRTGNRDGTVGFMNTCNMGDATNVQPRPHPTQFVISQRIKPVGAKPLFKVIVPKNATRLRIVLIRHDDVGTGTSAFNNRISDSWDLGASDLMMVNDGQTTETDARYVTVRFGKFLDLGVQYDAILFVVRGDNVDGDGGDIVRNPMVDFSQFGTDPNPNDPSNPNNGRFIAGVTTSGANSLLKEDTPFVAMNVLTDFVLKKRGVKAIMHVLMPSASTDLRIRITETSLSGSEISGSPTLADTWDDIQTTNSGPSGVTGQIKVQRRFGPTLDFNSRYKLKALVAEGPDVGLGSDKAVYRPATEIAFVTPGPDGNFIPPNGNLDFDGITRAKYKKNGNGVLVTMRIFAPRGTQRVTCRIQELLPPLSSDTSTNNATQTANSNEIIDYLFEDVAEEIETNNGFFTRQFGIKLEPNTYTNTNVNNYGVIRLIAEGDGINPDGAGGKNPNIFRNPSTKPATGSYTDQFNTNKPIGLTGFTVPAVPRILDLSNQIENDEAKVSMVVYAGNAVGDVNNRGVITFGDVGTTEAFVIVNRADQAGDNGMLDKLKFEVPVDPTATQVEIQLEGLKTGKKYYIPRVGLKSGSDVAKTPAPDPMNTIKFRAGFDIDLTLINFFTVNQPLAVDSRTSQVTVSYNVPPGLNVLARKLQLYKDIQNKTAGYKLVGEYVLRDDQDSASPGTHNYDFQSTHPANAQIRYKATLVPIKGGVARGDALFPANGTYDFTGDDPEVGDVARPSFGPTNQPNMRVRWKQEILKIRCNLPDQNIRTFSGTYVQVIFRCGDVQNTNGGLGKLYTYNPATNISIRTGLFDLPIITNPPDTTYFASLGQASGDAFELQRPDLTSAGDDFPLDIYNDLLANYLEFTNNGPRKAFALYDMTAILYFFNSVGATQVSATSIRFPFRPKMEGIGTTAGVGQPL